MLGAAFQKPTGQIEGELEGAVFQLVEGRKWCGSVLGKEPIKDGVGMFPPLVSEFVAFGSGACGGHGNTSA
jgi:hypothetical protein